MGGSLTASIVVALLTLGSPFGAPARHQDAEPVHQRLLLKVSADAGLKARVEKELRDGLAALPRVQVTEQNSDVTVSVIVLQVSTRSRRDMGATFSVTVTERLGDRARQFAMTHVDPEHRDQFLALLEDAVKPLAHWVETAAPDQLPQACRSIVESVGRAIVKRVSPLAPPERK